MSKCYEIFISLRRIINHTMKKDISKVQLPIIDLNVIQNKIYFIKNQYVMLDRDLAELYQVETKVLNQAVKRNIKRFPEDFMFKLSHDETANLRSHFVTSSWGGSRYQPLAFTEQGLAMLSGLLNSDVAIQVNINIMRAFVVLRNKISELSTINLKVDNVAKQVEQLNKEMEEILRDQNDINEMQEQTNQDVNMQLELINISLAELQSAVTQSTSNTLVQPIGFRVKE